MESNTLRAAPSRSQALGKVPNAAEAFPKDYPSPPQPWNPSQGLVLIHCSSLSHISPTSPHPETLSSPLPCPGIWGAGVPERPGNPALAAPDPEVPVHVHPGSLRTAQCLEPMSSSGRRQRAAVPGSAMGSGDPAG